ncbi:MAG: Gfo/Idh/MocA family oxidoreductase [Ardenticatenaceae bacterium]|nr:Gfo/Idh/MocA family oxidoreductase [Ardenticatenaceae bacterium]
MPSRVKVGVIGVGSVAQIMHLPYLYELDDRFEVTAIADIAPGALAVVGDFYHIDQRFTDYRDLLATDVDAVLILTGGSHTPVVLDALAAGKHILVEKPLAFTVREADEIVAAVEGSDRTVMVGYMKRYDPGYCYAQRQVAEIPDLRSIQIHTFHPANEAYWWHHRIMRAPGVPALDQGRGPGDAAQQMRQIGAGTRSGSEAALYDEALGADAPMIQRIAYAIMLSSLVHDVNALRGLVGEPAGVAHTELWNGGLAITTVLRFPGELRAAYTWVYLDELRDYQEHIAVLAPSARVRIEFPSPFLRSMPTPVVVQREEDGAATEKRVIVNYEEAFKEELRHFYECIITGRQPVTTIRDAREDIYWLHQMALAWRG